MRTKIDQSGFTLVELIVVITILAILGTVAFISVSKYTETARNAVRLDAISKIAVSINSSKNMGQNLLAFSNTGSEVPNAQIQGTGATSANYKAGEFNETSLDVKEVDFLDPFSRHKYLVGVTSKKTGDHEVAASIEEGNLVIARVLGSYSPRTVTSISGTKGSQDNSFVLSSYQDIGKFLVNDYIAGTDVPAGTYLSNISSDGMTLTLSEDIPGTVTGIELNSDEVAGLILGLGGSTPVLDEGGELPYPMGASSSFGGSSSGGVPTCTFGSGTYGGCTFGS